MNDDILIHHLGSIDSQLRDLRKGQDALVRDLGEERVVTTRSVTRVATRVSTIVGGGTFTASGLMAWAFKALG